MLSDKDIDNLIQPFIDRQQHLETYIVETIASRVKEVGKLSKSDVYQLQQLLKIGSSAKDINRQISKILNIQEKATKKMIKDVALNTYKGAKPFYDYRHKTQIPFEKNKKLQRSIEVVGEQTANTFKNLSNSRAIGFIVRDSKNPNINRFYTTMDAYRSVIDEAVQAVQTGVLDFNTAMRKTMKQLNDSGIRRLYWDTGYSRRLDSIVRMNILGGIRQINQKVQTQIAEEVNADGIELSAHDFSAPDHEPIQGHIFTLANFEKLQSGMRFEDTYGNKFNSIQRPIGEWNCKHFTQAVIIASHIPTWSLQELNELKQRNNKGYTTKKGKHYTMYQCSQIQRQYETKIRYAKEGYLMAKSCGDPQLMDYYKTKSASLNREYTQFSKDCGLSKKRDRTSVSGFYY
jgi:hypothetical protein